MFCALLRCHLPLSNSEGGENGKLCFLKYWFSYRTYSSATPFIWGVLQRLFSASQFVRADIFLFRNVLRNSGYSKPLISGKKYIYTNSSFFFNICFSLLEQEMPAANLHGHIFAAPLCSPHLRKPTRRQGRFTRLNKQKPSRDARHGADFFLYLSSLGLCTAPRSKPQRGDPSPAPRSLGARLAAN